MEKCGMEVFLKTILTDQQVLMSHITVHGYFAIMESE